MSVHLHYVHMQANAHRRMKVDITRLKKNPEKYTSAIVEESLCVMWLWCCWFGEHTGKQTSCLITRCRSRLLLLLQYSETTSLSLHALQLFYCTYCRVVCGYPPSTQYYLPFSVRQLQALSLVTQFCAKKP